MAYFMSFRNIFILVFGLIFPIYGISCDIEFSGTQFLNASHGRGIRPESTCLVTDISKNRFFAFPDRSCKLFFANASWLNEGWSFKRIQGGGTFISQRSNEGITVLIDAAGGFRLNSIMLSSSAANCDKVTLDKVL